MTARLPTSRWRRILGGAVCYVLAIQAFLAAFETTIAVTRVGALDVGPVICQGAGGASQPTGDTGKRRELPCLHCAIAAAGVGVLSDPVPTTGAPLLALARSGFANPSAIPIRPPARAGRSRAPPSFA